MCRILFRLEPSPVLWSGSVSFLQYFSLKFSKLQNFILRNIFIFCCQILRLRKGSGWLKGFKWFAIFEWLDSFNLPLRFPDALQSGLLEIIAPPASFYPDLNEVRVTLNDPVERVKWRTKQNLDYAFLMMYAQSRGTYYVQLEDDILTTSGYITKMIKFALGKEAKKEDWFLLDFCQLGFIGKMFKSVDLPYFIQFAVMFANDKPVDWLLDPLLDTRYCPHDAVNHGIFCRNRVVFLSS